MAMQRDTLTGVAVLDLSLIFRDDDGLPCSPPTQLHTRLVEGRNGGRTFTSNALRAMHDNDKRNQPRSLTYVETHWWTPEGMERELYAFFPHDLVNIVLAVRRDQQSWDDALYGMPYSIDHVKLYMRVMAKHCRALIHETA